MAYIVSGGTGFIGKHLIDRLVMRGQPIYVLVRPSSLANLERLRNTRWSSWSELVQPLVGDIGQPRCGVTDQALASLEPISSLFHLAAIYDMDVTPAAAWAANVAGTEHALELAEAVNARLEHVSSIAVTGGVVPGVFMEAMFDRGQKLDHPYYVTKFESEKRVREQTRVPYRIYRPGVVVGSSLSGEIDKIDGPYYAFPFLKLARRSLPRWAPLIGIDGGVLNIVPVDYVASALDAIAHADGNDGQTFHLVGPNAPSLMGAMSELSKAAGGPRYAVSLPRAVTATRSSRKPSPLALAVRDGFLEKTGIPESVLDASEWITRFDTSNAERVLAPLGIRCPELPAYADKLWTYWERELRGKGKASRPKPEDRGVLTRGVRDKRVVVTGASSGIGEAVARAVVRDGGVPILVARNEDKLRTLRDELVDQGGRAEYFACDLNDATQIEALVAHLREGPAIDVLVNNAGRSIRRSLSHSYDRIHDYERTMQLNFFGALRLTMGLLPGMRARRNGHIINISSAGVLINTPRFSAYIASKAAFDAFSDVAAGEALSDNVHFTTVYMPLVRTKMIAPTKGYANAPALTPEQAAEWVMRAIRDRPKRMSGNVAQAFHALDGLNPSLMTKLRNLGYRFTPGSRNTRQAKQAAQ
jgi:short-subunit dehydrogenase/thioester reductase-like protein